MKDKGTKLLIFYFHYLINDMYIVDIICIWMEQDHFFFEGVQFYSEVILIHQDSQIKLC